MTDEQPRTVYLDYAATTPVDPRVRARMAEYLDNDEAFGNPSSEHAYGYRARAAVQEAAGNVAALIGGEPDELIWTSGATESNNLAIMGAARYRRMRGSHIVTIATEHKSVLASCAVLEGEGFTVTYLRPDETGLVAPEAVAAALRPDTILVSVMHANNEIGVVQDIAAIGQLCRDRDVLFHVDAAQSAGKLTVDVAAQHIDLLSLNAHKACGPKGIGAVWLNSERIRRVAALLHGGGQQRGMRSGTLPVHQIVGMGETYAILNQEMTAEIARCHELRQHLWEGIRDLPGVLLNGNAQHCLGSILNVSVARVEGESLLFALRDLAVSSGSACNSASGEPSYVLRSLGRSDQQAEASIRFSFGRFTQLGDIDLAIARFRAAVTYLQELAPADVTGREA